MPAAASLKIGALPIGLAHGVRLLRPVQKGEAIRASDVELSEDQLASAAIEARKALEATVAKTNVKSLV
jgi:predicted homoserine dehydrogenase-like protein